MRAWVERVVRQASQASEARKPRRFPESQPRQVDAPAESRLHIQSGKQIIVRVDDDLLKELRKVIGRGRGAVSQWLVDEITQYVISQDVDLTLLISTDLKNIVKDVLPKETSARQAVVRTLLDGPRPVIDEALADASLGLRKAIRDANLSLADDILQISAKKVELRERLEQLCGTEG